MLTQLMTKIIELKRINKSLFQKQELIEKYTKNVLDLDLSSDSVIDEIKVCRSDVNIIELKQFGLFSQLKAHELIHSNERKIVCDWSQCRKRFKTKGDLNLHKRY